MRPGWKMGIMKPRGNRMLNRRTRWALWDRRSAPQEQGPSGDPSPTLHLLSLPGPVLVRTLPNIRWEGLIWVCSVPRELEPLGFFFGREVVTEEEWPAA